MSFLNNRIIWSALLSKKAGRKPDHTRSNCSGEEEIIGKFMWFTPFNIQLKVGVDLPDTLNASVFHDLATERLCNKKKSVDVCPAFKLWVHTQSHCPLVETCFWQWQLDLWRCKIWEHVAMWTCSWHWKYVGSGEKQCLKCIEPETNHIWKRLTERLCWIWKEAGIVKLKDTIRIYH